MFERSRNPVVTQEKRGGDDAFESDSDPLDVVVTVINRCATLHTAVAFIR